MDGLTELLATHLLTGVERQGQLADATGDTQWHADLRAGTLSFGNDQVYPVDVIGSAASEAGTWLWAWANQSLPPGLGDPSTQLRAYGDQHEIAQLTTSQLPLGPPPDGIDAHLAGLISVPVLGAQAYYVAPNGPQSVVLVLHDPSLELGPLTGPALRTTLTGGLGMYNIHHALSIRPYLAQRGASLREEGPRWDVTTSDGQVTSLHLDETGLVVSIEATLVPAPAPPSPEESREKRSWWRR